jgi:hypothetical protein
MRVPKSQLSIITLVIAVLLSTSTVYTFASGSGTNAAEFLKLNPDPRVVSMGGGAVAELSGVPSTSINNPAGLLSVSRAKLSLNYMMLVEDMRYHFGSFAMPTSYGNIGVSIIYLTYGDIQGYDVSYSKINIPASYDTAVVLSYALPIKATVPIYKEYGAVGANIKLLHSKLAEYSAESIALDVGGIYNVPNSRDRGRGDLVRGQHVGKGI